MGKGTKASELSGRVPGVSLAWENVKYTVETKKNKAVSTKTILGGVSGSLDPGKLLALMGPSGSGKTSLLNALAGRVPLSSPNDKLTGAITVNGEAQADMSQLSACKLTRVTPVHIGPPPVTLRYVADVMQDDNLFAYSTVQETLMFAASLRLPSSMSFEDKQRHVDTVIGKLGLTPARDVIIGNHKARGVSGGERKRVTIGVELLHDPPLVFLDEPTSGLDSFQAQSVMETLRNLASNGHTVVCSIHQPRSSIYAIVDSLMLLAGGRCAYYGPSGPSCHNYFAGLGHPVPDDFNPADHLLDIISVDYRSKEQESDSKTRVDTILNSWHTSTAHKVANEGSASTKDEESHTISATELSETVHLKALTDKYAAEHGGGGASCCTAFPLLLTRTWRELTRNKAELALQICMNVFFSALFGEYTRTPCFAYYKCAQL